MEPLNKVKWDVVLGSTGLAESLLALSLSRSDKKILHVDNNGYYGGTEAALGLPDVEAWVKDVQQGSMPYFSNAQIRIREADKADGLTKITSPRAYSLALAPQLIYTKSALIPLLVSSKVYRQLEFLAVGSWWVYEAPATVDQSAEATGSLRKIPTRREEVFEDKSLDLKAKRSLIKFLRLVINEEARTGAIESSGALDLESYLKECFGIPLSLQAGLHALTLAPWPPSRTPVSYALPRINRHLSSFGVFGAGFSAVIPKWGGFAEVAQVACRALAVGGGVYMLGSGIRGRNEGGVRESHGTVDLELGNGDTVQTSWVTDPSIDSTDGTLSFVTRSVTIVGSAVKAILPSLGEGVPKPAAAVVVFPGNSLDSSSEADVPVYLMVHSSETGECPAEQGIVYASVALAGDLATTLLSEAVSKFLRSIGNDPEAAVRWALQYQQQGLQPLNDASATARVSACQASRHSEGSDPARVQPHLVLPSPSLDLAFDDGLIPAIKTAWQTITGAQTGFMEFEDREAGAYDTDLDE